MILHSDLEGNDCKYMKITMSLHSNLAFRNLQCACRSFPDLKNTRAKDRVYFNLIEQGDKIKLNRNRFDPSLLLLLFF